MLNLIGFLIIGIYIGFALFQLALALGQPWGFLAYGGRHKTTLPNNLRWASVVAIVVFLVGMYAILGFIEIIPDGGWETIFLWILTGFLGLNTLGNLASESKHERMIMTPISALLVILQLRLLLS